MKKTIMLILVLLILTGCKKNYITCNINVENNSREYTLNGEYKIYHKNSYVKKIEKVDLYTSENRDIIDFISESKDIELSNLNDNYGGFNYEIFKDKKSVKVKTLVILDDVNIKKMLKDGYIDKYYVNNNQLTLGGIRLYYESKGAICEGGKS